MVEGPAERGALVLEVVGGSAEDAFSCWYHCRKRRWLVQDLGFATSALQVDAGIKK